MPPCVPVSSSVRTRGWWRSSGTTRAGSSVSGLALWPMRRCRSANSSPRWQRFIDETRYGAAVGNALVREQGGKGWLLVDAEQMRCAREQLAGEAIWFQRLQAESLLRTSAVRGGTPEEVARRAGICPDGLAATIRAHNEAIAQGESDPMGKPRDSTHPIAEGPFTLLDVSVRPKLTNPCPIHPRRAGGGRGHRRGAIGVCSPAAGPPNPPPRECRRPPPTDRLQPRHATGRPASRSGGCSINAVHRSFSAG